MPFTIGNAAAAERRVAIRFNKEELKLYYNAGEGYANYQHTVERKDAQMAELGMEAERARRAARASDLDPEQDAEAQAKLQAVADKLQKAVKRARLELCEQLCQVIVSWDLVAGEDYDRTTIRENFLKKLKEAGEEKEISKEDVKELQSLDGPGEIPVKGIWLHALPLPDKFILDIVAAINEDFESGGKGSKKL